MDAHRVDVFDEADGDLPAVRVADDFELELFPAEDALLDQHLTDQARAQAAGADGAEFLDVVDDAAAGAAHGVRRTQDDRVAEFGRDLFRLFERVGRLGLGHRDADRIHCLLEGDAVFAALDGVQVDADDFHVIFVEDARFVQGDGEVQAGLAAEVGQQGVGLFAGDDAFEAFGIQGFDVGMVGDAGVGHDGGGVAVDEDDLVPFLAERFARLRAGIVEFAGLSDDDRSRADDDDLVDVGAFGHNGSFLASQV